MGHFLTPCVAQPCPHSRPHRRCQDRVGAGSPLSTATSAPPPWQGSPGGRRVPLTPFLPLPPSRRMADKRPRHPRQAWEEVRATPSPSSGPKPREMCKVQPLQAGECAGAAGRGLPTPPCPALCQACTPQPGWHQGSRGASPITASRGREPPCPLMTAHPSPRHAGAPSLCCPPTSCPRPWWAQGTPLSQP